MKRFLSLFLTVAVIATLAGCGRGDREDENSIPESTGGKDLVRAESVDSVFSLNTNPN